MFPNTRRLVASALVLTLGLPAAAADAPDLTTDAPAREEPSLAPHRYAFVAGGVLLLGGAGLGFLARGESARARSLSSARESQIALDRAQTQAATANVLYGVAGAAILYGLVLEFLPEPAADKARLTFHF